MTRELHHNRLEIPRPPRNPGGADDETRFRFSEAAYGLGEYVSLQAADGATPTFRFGQLPAL